jgi:hypothetical protein
MFKNNNATDLYTLILLKMICCRFFYEETTTLISEIQFLYGSNICPKPFSANTNWNIHH